MEKKLSGLSSIAEILERRVINGQQPVLTLLDLVKNWPDIVGDMIAEQAFPVRLQRETLVLKTATTIWANELQLMVPRLIEEIREQCPQLKIEKLRFVS